MDQNLLQYTAAHCMDLQRGPKMQTPGNAEQTFNVDRKRAVY